MTISLTRPLAPVLLAATLALTACSGDGEATFEDAASAPSQEAEASQQDGEEGARDQGETQESEGEDPNVADESAAAAGVNLSDAGDPVATATIPVMVDGDPNATMDISLHSLTRDGKTVVGIFSFTVSADVDANPGSKSLFQYLGNRRWYPHLIDSSNLTRHDVLSGSSSPNQQAVTDSASTDFAPGQTLFGYAAFAAPPEDVTSMTVNLIDGAPAAQDVPVK